MYSITVFLQYYCFNLKLHTGGNVNTSCLECYTRLFLNFVPSCLSLQTVFEKGARYTCRHYFTPYTNASFFIKRQYN